MTTFFFRRSVEKAFQLDESPNGLSLNMSRPIDSNPPYIISAVDDVMYIVNAVIQKSLSTAQRDVTVAVISTISRVLGSDFVRIVQRKMQDESYLKAQVQGGFPPEDKIVSFIVLINSLDMAMEYLARIISGRLGSQDEHTNGASHHPSLHQSLQGSFPLERDVAFVATALATLQSSFTSKATDVLNEMLQVLFSQVIKPRLRPVLTDSFRDVDYSLSEGEVADMARQTDGDEEGVLEQVSRRFEHGWDQLMRPIARLMAPRTFTILLDLTARYLAKVLEKRVWSYSGRTNAFGAIRMERDFSGIISAVSKGNYGVRELFSKITQILMVANMDEEEWKELGAGRDVAGGDDGFLWVLEEIERRKARMLVRE